MFLPRQSYRARSLVSKDFYEDGELCRLQKAKMEALKAPAKSPKLQSFLDKILRAGSNHKRA